MEASQNLNVLFTGLLMTNQLELFHEELPDPHFQNENIKNFEEELVYFPKTTGEIENEQNYFLELFTSFPKFEDELSELSVFPLNGSLEEKDDNFSFDFTSEKINFCDLDLIYEKTSPLCYSQKLKKYKNYKSLNKRRNIILESWCLLRKLFLKYLSSEATIHLIKKDFDKNFRLWKHGFNGFYKIFIKCAKKIPQHKISMAFLEQRHLFDFQLQAIINILRKLFTSFIEEKASLYIRFLEKLNCTRKEILLEMVILIRTKLQKKDWEILE